MSDCVECTVSAKRLFYEARPGSLLLRLVASSLEERTNGQLRTADAENDGVVRRPGMI